MVVGAGAAGVEMATCLKERFSKTFANKPSVSFHFTIINSHTSLNESLESPQLGSAVAEALFSRGINVIHNSKAVKVEQGKVHISSGSVIDFNLLLWVP